VRDQERSTLKVVHFLNASTVKIVSGGQVATLRVGDRFSDWTFMGVAAGTHNSAILEDFTDQTRHLLVVDTKGVRLNRPKSLELTSQDARTLYLGHTLDEIKSSSSDLLADQILVGADDPAYDEVASDEESAAIPCDNRAPTFARYCALALE
jgi:hypothetical protein